MPCQLGARCAGAIRRGEGAPSPRGAGSAQERGRHVEAVATHCALSGPPTVPFMPDQELLRRARLANALGSS